MRGATEVERDREFGVNISIHAPLAGCDASIVGVPANLRTFQSTHPLRGATASSKSSFFTSEFQSTHPLRGATSPRTSYSRSGCISIHAPHAGCDPFYSSFVSSGFDFNPRTPCGVRQQRELMQDRLIAISIHAPHAGCDKISSESSSTLYISIHAPHAGCDGRSRARSRRGAHFNPRTPCGVRLEHTYYRTDEYTFQSTHPMRGATLSAIRKHA